MNTASVSNLPTIGSPAMLPQASHRHSSGLQHYDDVLALTGQQYRLEADGVTIGVVLGMLDTRTGRMPIGLVDGRRGYWENTLYYDANRRCLDVADADRWVAFIGTYAGGGWLLSLVGGLGGFALMTVAAAGSVVLDMVRFALFPALLFGLVGLLVYGLVGYALAMTVLQALPYLLGGVAAWLGLCGLIALERRARCRRSQDRARADRCGPCLVRGRRGGEGLPLGCAGSLAGAGPSGRFRRRPGRRLARTPPRGRARGFRAG